MAKTIYVTQAPTQPANSKLNIIIGAVISIAVLGAIAYFGRKFYLKNFTALGFAKRIKAAGGLPTSTPEQAATLDKPFLKAWAEGIENGDATFTYQGNVYDAKLGTRKK